MGEDASEAIEKYQYMKEAEALCSGFFPVLNQTFFLEYETCRNYTIDIYYVFHMPTAVPFMAYAAKSDLSVTGSVIEIEKNAARC